MDDCDDAVDKIGETDGSQDKRMAPLLIEDSAPVMEMTWRLDDNAERTHTQTDTQTDIQTDTQTDHSAPVTQEDVGKRVIVQGYCGGYLRFFGFHATHGRLRCGIELDRPVGLNNGTVQGFQYFTCGHKHGVLVIPKKVSLEQPKPQESQSALATPSPDSSPTDHTDTASILSGYSVVSMSTIVSGETMAPTRSVSDCSTSSRLSDFVHIGIPLTT